MTNNNHTTCTACEARLQSVERRLAMALERLGIDVEAQSAEDIELVLDECSGNLAFGPLQEHLKRLHQRTEVAK